MGSENFYTWFVIVFYTNGILRKRNLTEHIFAPYDSITKIKINYYKRDNRKKVKIFQIFFLFDDNEHGFEISGFFNEKFILYLEEILKQRCSTIQWEVNDLENNLAEMTKKGETEKNESILAFLEKPIKMRF